VDGKKAEIHYVRRSWLLERHVTAITFPDMDPVLIFLPDDADGREIRESVLHELMHVALKQGGGENSYLNAYGGGESVINPTARILLDIMRDNPKLVEWMRKKP